MFQRFRRADTLNRFARPYILLFYAFASIFVVIHVAMTHIHSKLETLDPLPPEIRELIFHHILSTRYKPDTNLSNAPYQKHVASTSFVVTQLPSILPWPIFSFKA